MTLIYRYKILHVLEFDSTRKRMSVILEQESANDEVLMLCKGAESHVAPRCIAGHTQETLDHIDGYAEVRIFDIFWQKNEFSNPNIQK